MATVVLNHVYKIYPGDKGKDVVAVTDVNFEVADREFVVLVGPSGCGKSTTLRMVAGLEEISKGDIHIDGRRVNDVPPKDRDIAMVFQNYALYPHMSVYDNMAFGLKLRKMPRATIQERVMEAAKILGIESLLDRKPKALSGGQRQRVAVGRAIVRQPKVFLFDEPLSNLDAKMRVQMRAEITRLHQRLDATMIYVTHDQVEAMTMGTRIVVMKDGVVQQIAAPLDLYNNPANRFVAGFLGSPPMNFIEGRIEKTAGGLDFVEAIDGGKGIRLSASAASADLAPLAGKAVTLGIRPENVVPLFGDRPAGAATFEGVAEMVEPMGAETYIYIKGAAGTIISRTHAALTHEFIDKKLTFVAEMDRAHFFDAETGARIDKPAR